MSSKSQSRLGTRAKQIEEEKKKKEHNQEHTRSNAQYQDHELRRGATRYAHAQYTRTRAKQIEEKKKKEHNQEHTRSNAQYQDHELRQALHVMHMLKLTAQTASFGRA
ncbi:hypothetical protein BJY52DRAFT_1232383 [Lactarius psammicola]|nr:hypothetical protein BJY52DRAFT_1232383 [Lactarius psammicola]